MVEHKAVKLAVVVVDDVADLVLRGQGFQFDPGLLLPVKQVHVVFYLVLNLRLFGLSACSTSSKFGLLAGLLGFLEASQ
jgi:hypothetical protein